MKISEYLDKRLSSNKDDRNTKQKQWSDAELRGSIGVQKANKIIKTIDTLKMYR